MSNTWFITGCSRGLGVEFAKAALRAGNRIVATGRKREAVTERLGRDSDQLLVLDLDVTDESAAKTAVAAAVARFGGIDVLVNNAGYGHLGFFEENTAQDDRAQFDTNIFGVFNVTRAVLPVMRAARKGRIFNISSTAGIRGAEFVSLYCATKFGLEGFSEALALELAPFGVFVTIVAPSSFRTDFLSGESLRFGGHQIHDYEARRAQIRSSFEERSGLQPGDPVKLADAMVRLSTEANPPMRFMAGAFAVQSMDTKLGSVRAELDQWRQLSLSLDYPSS
jgi:NAD(P)-dependent dehydrogenase (short-subunit alcohol dehydrogenase family)